MPDCGDNSCMYRTKPSGMRTNGGCRCDVCPKCCSHVTPSMFWRKHYRWCPQPEWVPEHHRAALDAAEAVGAPRCECGKLVGHTRECNRNTAPESNRSGILTPPPGA